MQEYIILGFGTTLIISNIEMESIMKIVIFMEDSGFLLKRVSETIQNKAKKQKEDLLVCYWVH